ncbi:hypothetical protein IF650_02070 [Cellulosimicrobium terreum]|nr:hypothetical protein [Cellulosimicrobium terreum]
MAQRFVPPPGWPTPPSFTPTSDWHPDASWPPAPEGWVFWVDDDAPAAAPTRRSMRATRPDGAVLADAHPVVSSTMILPALVGAGPDASTPAPPTRRAPALVPVPVPAPASRDVAPSMAAPQERVLSMGPLSLPGADDDDGEPGRARRWIVPAAFALAGVAVGLLVGIGLTLTAQGEADAAMAEAQRIEDEAAAERAQLETERADLETQRSEVDAASTALDEREDAVTQSEEDAAARSADLDERAAQQQRDKEAREREEAAQQPGQPGNPGNGQGNGQGGDQDTGWDWGDLGLG